MFWYYVWSILSVGLLPAYKVAVRKGVTEALQGLNAQNVSSPAFRQTVQREVTA